MPWGFLCFFENTHMQREKNGWTTWLLLLFIYYIVCFFSGLDIYEDLIENNIYFSIGQNTFLCAEWYALTLK